MDFRPLGTHVLVRPVEPDATTAGGIIVPDTAKERPMQGEVLAVGPGARNEAGGRHRPEVVEGDHVLYGKWAGTEAKIEGQDLVIISETDIFGVLKNAGKNRKAA